MNCIDEVNKQKEYYNGLQEAIDMLMPEQVRHDIEEFLAYEEVSEECKQSVKFWMDVVGPFANAISYIFNNRFILEEKVSIMEDESMDEPVMLTNEIFTTLKRLNKETVKSFIASSLQVGSVVMERLFQSYLDDDETRFANLIMQEKCDTTRLARLCRSCWDNAHTGFSIQDNDFPYLLDFISDSLTDSPGDENLLEKTERLQSSTAELNDVIDSDDETFYQNLDQYYSDYYQFCKSYFREYLHYYWEWYDDFTFRERKLIEAIIRQPQAKELYAKFEVEFQSKETGSDAIPKEPFILPADFFSIDNQHTDSKEFFYVDAKIKHKGVSAFVTFINYLAEQGYIKDDNRVKALFAYRMTGRNRPQGDLPPIAWQGKNGKPYELIYIVKFFSERGDYAKMRLFFTSPEWPKDRDSSYAQGANSELRRFVEELYG